MKRERWREISRIYHAAIDVEESQRREFIEKACAGDTELLHEVESLLAHREQAGGLMAVPAAEIVAIGLARDQSNGRCEDLAGRTLLHYRIDERIGRGGMGDVYRARDLTLGREVALKVLPSSFSADPERLARFRREAHALAALNHPNIAAVHELREAEGIPLLVMELVEGVTLADRIGRGSIPLEEALRFARQIAEALEAAHEGGIIHRDLKPANVKITPEGRIKLLDFGLARIMEPMETDTFVTPGMADTRSGVILGTAAYMAPEQAGGSSVDKRADIWSFGVVMFEMVSGKQPFSGETVSETLAAVLRVEVDWELLPFEVPSTLRRLVRRCLTRDPTLRLRDIGEARIAIDIWVVNPAGGSPQRFTSYDGIDVCQV